MARTTAETLNRTDADPVPDPEPAPEPVPDPEPAPEPVPPLTLDALGDEPDHVPTDAPPVQVKELVRDALQLRVDGWVKAAYDEWIAAGKPGAFNDSPRKHRAFAHPAMAEAFRELLKAAGRYHNIRVRISPTKVEADGKHGLHFVVTDRVPRKPGGPATDIGQGQDSTAGPVPGIEGQPDPAGQEET